MIWSDPLESDKHTWHRYSGFYRQQFATLGPVDSVLEYGVLQGASIRWLRALFPQAAIVGVDILPPQPAWPADPGITYITANQGDRTGIASMLRALDRRFDLVIEDGSHLPAHQAICLAETFPYVQPGGMYVLEDLHAAHPLHPYYRAHCAPGTPASLHLLLLLERLLATRQAITPVQCERLASDGLFTRTDVARLAQAIGAVDLHHRATLPLRCYACGSDAFDPVALTCACGMSLDFIAVDSITAVLRPRAGI